MANAMSQVVMILLGILFALAMHSIATNQNTSSAVIQNQELSNHQQWKGVADYADHLAAKARNAEQYFQ